MEQSRGGARRPEWEHHAHKTKTDGRHRGGGKPLGDNRKHCHGHDKALILFFVFIMKELKL